MSLRGRPVLPQNTMCAENRVSWGGRGELGLDPAEPWFVRDPGTGSRTGTAGQGAPPTGTQCRWGMAVLRQARTVLRGSTMVRQSDPWDCSAGEDPVPEPFRPQLPREARSEGRAGGALKA